MKQNLIIVKNKLNDKGSNAYLAQIRKQWRESFEEDINLITYEIDEQSVLEEVLLEPRNSNAKVLLLTPTSLHIPSHMEHRNAEKDQTANWVAHNIKLLYGRARTKVLVVGGIEGNVSGKIAMELMKCKYCVTVSGSQFDITDDFSGQFDVIVNATPVNADVEFYVNCSTLFDVSGNFVSGQKMISVEEDGEVKFAFLNSEVKNFVGVKEIGWNTVWNMLSGIKEG